jgi:putative PIN family toxin of toxin-antitoxin system
MQIPRIVIDTSVFIAALRSQQGASYKLLMLVDSEKFETNISVPLIFEYEDAAKRLVGEIALTVRDIDNILDYFCAIATHRTIFYLWRPFLKDPKDDMVLELAVTAACDYLVTYNERDFEGVEQQFGIKVVTAKEFLRKIGEIR